MWPWVRMVPDSDLGKLELGKDGGKQELCIRRAPSRETCLPSRGCPGLEFRPGGIDVGFVGT